MLFVARSWSGFRRFALYELADCDLLFVCHLGQVLRSAVFVVLFMP